ncbi:MBL fold metallo-hydrolase [Streptomyces sp. NPDC002540]
MTGIGAEPSVRVGQRALLVRSPAGNVLWDCLGYLDDDLAAEVERLGGISAVAVSHPHFYGVMTEWGRAFDAPVYVHAADRDWVPRPDRVVEFWSGDTHRIADGLTLINAGTHFAGGTVLHWADDPDGQGALFSGDIFMVVADRRWVSFMYSIPNFVPERPRTIRRVLALVEPFEFARIYGAFWGRVVAGGGSDAARRSAERHLRFALDEGAPADRNPRAALPRTSEARGPGTVAPRVKPGGEGQRQRSERGALGGGRHVLETSAGALPR